MFPTRTPVTTDVFPSGLIRAMATLLPAVSTFSASRPGMPIADATAKRTCRRRQHAMYSTRPNMPSTKTPDSPNTMLVAEIGTIAPGGSKGEGGDAILGVPGGSPVVPGGKGGGLGLGDGFGLAGGGCAGAGSCGGGVFGPGHSGMMPHVWSNTSRFLPELSRRQSSAIRSMCAPGPQSGSGEIETPPSKKPAPVTEASSYPILIVHP
jgi:hypothetical protein